MITCGIDEAGRGPVFGPMVICGICGKEEDFSNLGVKDSKALTPARREKLYSKILEVASGYAIEMVQPEEIDSLRKKFSLNEIEAIYISKIITRLSGDTYIVDAADVNEERFSETIKKYLERNVTIISRHKADRDFPAVSAASIVAKVTRDREIERLKQILGDFGSGYPSDPRTIGFLKEYYSRHGTFPPYTRRSWDTLKKVISLDNFLGDDERG